MGCVLKATWEVQVLLAPFPNAGHPYYAFRDTVGGDGVDVGWVPVRIFARLWGGSGELLVARGHSLKSQARVVVMEGSDDVLGREMRWDEGGGVEIVLRERHGEAPGSYKSRRDGGL